jgi:DNA-binding NarL/FixJ family response regulator
VIRSIEAIKTAVRVLTAMTDRQVPNEADVEELRQLVPLLVNVPVDELACEVIKQVIEAAQATRWRVDLGGARASHGAALTEGDALGTYAHGLLAFAPLALAWCSQIGQARKGRSAADILTPREIAVLRLIAAGLSTRQVAAQLGIKFKTAAAHRASIMQKLDTHTVEAVRYAIRHGLVEP